MIKRITVDLHTVENLLFFWNMIAEREKVSEIFILSVAELPQFQAIYDEEFDNISVRKVLSALSNREVFRGDNRRESRFWVDNLWMLEDLEYTMRMVTPLKQLHLEDLVEPLNRLVPQDRYEELKVVFVPFPRRTSVIRGNGLYINFFRTLPRKGKGEGGRIDGHPMKSFIEEQLAELLRKAGQEGYRSVQDSTLRNVFY